MPYISVARTPDSCSTSTGTTQEEFYFLGPYFLKAYPGGGTVLTTRPFGRAQRDLHTGMHAPRIEFGSKAGAWRRGSGGRVPGFPMLPRIPSRRVHLAANCIERCTASHASSGDELSHLTKRKAPSTVATRMAGVRSLDAHSRRQRARTVWSGRKYFLWTQENPLAD